MQAAVIIVDPGHGGEDLGAHNVAFHKKYNKKLMIYEKNLVLSIAKKIRQNLSKHHTTYLTRSFDKTMQLQERAELVEKLNADLFISVHANSSTSSSSNGFETYFLDNHDDVAVKKVENIENKDSQGDLKVINQIIIDLAIEKTVVSSKALATQIHESVREHVAGRYGLKDRGVRPGLFYVLALTKIPGVLLEIGFLSNDTEATKMTSDKFQERYAKAVSDAVISYLEKTKKKQVQLF